ncbi:hypothetical protein ACQ86N_24925 [Puia sp. P3]|uniref:hypothetical protein n=1 Tax=Puia sp. P3 TaxID=3423952 RepID=UPI003D66C837
MTDCAHNESRATLLNRIYKTRLAACTIPYCSVTRSVSLADTACTSRRKIEYPIGRYPIASRDAAASI